MHVILLADPNEVNGKCRRKFSGFCLEEENEDEDEEKMRSV